MLCVGEIRLDNDTFLAKNHLPLASLTRVPLQEPDRIEYYNQLFCLCGHLGGGGVCV